MCTSCVVCSVPHTRRCVIALLTTGLFENTEISSVRPSSSLAIRISNDDTISATIEIEVFSRAELQKY